jgi:predicted RNase H-like HicB family nuclease
MILIAFSRCVNYSTLTKSNDREDAMHKYTAVIEKCQETGMYVGYIPGFPGAHSQGETLDELNRNLKEVVQMLLEDGAPKFDGEFIGTQLIEVA